MLNRPPVCLLLLLLISVPSFADDGTEYFEKYIRPVLVKSCYKCHSKDTKEPKGELQLDTREGTRRGGESGHSVVPGNLDDSMLMEALKYEGLEMPPNKQLPDEVIARFEKWIEMGAPDPRDGEAGIIKRTIDFEKSREFWSFREIQSPNVPIIRESNWAKTDIDRFVAAQLERKGLYPVADASPQVLVRRLHFDLIGLPPTPIETDNFVAAWKKDNDTAIEALVDELLGSPLFGERWGRHWMDVVRYGESTGMERNYTYPEAWRYRDYVIAAFNADKPFNTFIHEQIAGDLLPAESTEQRKQHLIATGVLAFGTKTLNERDREAFLMDIVEDQIDVTTRAFIGLTAGCARCHDHKFDPIPQEEYYSLAGIFRSTNTFYGTGGGNGNRQSGKLLTISDQGVQQISVSGGGNKNSAKNVNGLQRQIKALETRLEKSAQQIARASSAAQKKKLNVAHERSEKQLKSLNSRIRQMEKTASGDTKTVSVKIMGVQDAASVGDTQLRIRGEANERADSIPRGFLTIATLGDPHPINSDSSGRLEYAQWLTSQSNPLTARVAVNRIWQHLFGRGIVSTVNNFGANGSRPTHPQLLDWMATDFVKEGWSFKKTIRNIVLSRVYRLSIAENPEAEKVDQGNLLLWRANHRRLEAEALRDAVLFASGQIDLEPGVMSVVTTIGNGDIGRTINSSRFGSNSTKRSVYLPIVRGAIPEILKLFDFPEPSIMGGQRDVTTVPTQALYMMNSPFVIDQSNHLARRLLAEEELDDYDRVVMAYRLTLSRVPTTQESQHANQFLQDAVASLGGGELSNQDDQKTILAWTGLAQALFASAEFRYIE
ncbi:MAG: hypothetical protein COA78_16060 [Blastopirellula sp.]|nr:MAG: hypothetical protein COA78_16060 [Blastopirellula sp.]